jgi:hypothetical protein
VTGDGEGLCRRRGWWLGEVADRSGLTAGFGPVLATVPRRCHDPGCASLRGQPRLFGPVPSRSTAQRAAFAVPGESDEFYEAATSVYREPYGRGDREILVEEDQWA